MNVKRILIFGLLLLVVVGCTQMKVTRQVISAPGAPKAIGPYSQAILVGHTLYLAGQLGLEPQTGKLVGDDFAAQARQALENQKAVLIHAGFSLADVVQCQVFVRDLNNYAKFNEIYKEYFHQDYPARAVLEVSRIPADGLIEIMMVAVKGN